MLWIPFLLVHAILGIETDQRLTLCHQPKASPSAQRRYLHLKAILHFASTRTLHRGQLLLVFAESKPYFVCTSDKVLLMNLAESR